MRACTSCCARRSLTAAGSTRRRCARHRDREEPDTNADLKYAAKPPGGAWTTTTVDSAGEIGEYTSLAVDAAGGVHISYLDGTNAELRYAYRCF